MSTHVVVVTGGSRGLGSQMVKTFARAGHTVFAGYNSGAREATRICDELTADGLAAYPLQFDLGNRVSVESAHQAVVDTAGPVDVLINNAAYRPLSRFEESTDEEWEAVLSVNVLGAVRWARLVVGPMARRGFGRVINISGLDALWGWGNRAHVTVSKAGLMGLSRAIAVEFSHLGVTANTVVPGSFATERDPASYPDWETMRQYLVDRTPVGRQGDPGEVAELCLFLASESAGYITGQDIHINGGAFPLLRNPLHTG